MYARMSCLRCSGHGYHTLPRNTLSELFTKKLQGGRGAGAWGSKDTLLCGPMPPSQCAPGPEKSKRKRMYTGGRAAAGALAGAAPAARRLRAYPPAAGARPRPAAGSRPAAYPPAPGCQPSAPSSRRRRA